MNFLIIGGAFVVGVAAIIGIVLLVRSEEHPTRTSTSDQPVVHPVERREALPGRAAVPVRQNFPASTETSLPAVEANQQLSRFDGQFSELVAELRGLHQQAGELERRLGNLNEMVDAIEHSRNGRISVEEETQYPRDASTK